MTPLEIEILLRASYSPDLHPQAKSPAGQEAMAGFQRGGMIDGVGRITDKGRAHVVQLCRLPYPRSGWIDYCGVVIPESKC